MNSVTLIGAELQPSNQPFESCECGIRRHDRQAEEGFTYRVVHAILKFVHCLFALGAIAGCFLLAGYGRAVLLPRSRNEYPP